MRSQILPKAIALVAFASLCGCLGQPSDAAREVPTIELGSSLPLGGKPYGLAAIGSDVVVATIFDHTRVRLYRVAEAGLEQVELPVPASCRTDIRDIGPIVDLGDRLGYAFGCEDSYGVASYGIASWIPYQAEQLTIVEVDLPVGSVAANRSGEMLATVGGPDCGIPVEVSPAGVIEPVRGEAGVPGSTWSPEEALSHWRSSRHRGCLETFGRGSLPVLSDEGMIAFVASGVPDHPSEVTEAAHSLNVRSDGREMMLGRVRFPSGMAVSPSGRCLLVAGADGLELWSDQGDKIWARALTHQPTELNWARHTGDLLMVVADPLEGDDGADGASGDVAADLVVVPSSWVVEGAADAAECLAAGP